MLASKGLDFLVETADTGSARGDIPRPSAGGDEVAINLSSSSPVYCFLPFSHPLGQAHARSRATTIQHKERLVVKIQPFSKAGDSQSGQLASQGSLELDLSAK